MGHFAASPMQLLKFRVRSCPFSCRWISLSRKLTRIHCETDEQAEAMLNWLETVSPLFDPAQQKVFAGHPETETRLGYLRRINPAKRTAAMAIYSSPPELVAELGQISPELFETDRIEVGRRLDYSSWSNFVELRSSSRFKEIIGPLERLLELLPRNDGQWRELAQTLLKTCAPGDRLKDDLFSEVSKLLALLPPLTGKVHKLAQDIFEKNNRIEYFTEARKVVRRRLPWFVRLGTPNSRIRLQQRLLSQHPAISSRAPGSSNPSQMDVKTEVELALELSKLEERFPPIFLCRDISIPNQLPVSRHQIICITESPYSPDLPIGSSSWELHEFLEHLPLLSEEKKRKNR